MNPRNLLLESFQTALAAINPLHIVPQHLPLPPKGRTLIVGAGKAAASMALAVEKHWPKEAPLSGLVVTRYGHALPINRIEVVEAAHPLPDKAGQKYTGEIIRRVLQLGLNDLLIVLISGGGSSLLSFPVSGISVADLRKLTQQLLKSGAPIEEINTVRKHLSAIQGGRLAALSKSKVLALIISDVTGDDPTHIASGPCAPDPTTYKDAIEVLKRYKITPPPSIKKHLHLGKGGKIEETPKPGDSLFYRVENRIVATAHKSLEAAGSFFRNQGITPVLLGDTVTGEATEVAKVYGALVREIQKYHHPFPRPVALISGGECTVTVRGKGQGGRCTEFLLSLAINLGEINDVYALACGTDGIDGSENNAGAILTPDTLKRAQALALNAKQFLANNDSYNFFSRLNDLVITGPTRTNANDYRIILIL